VVAIGCGKICLAHGFRARPASYWCSGGGIAQEFDPYHRWLGIPPNQQPANLYRLLGIELFESDLPAADQSPRVADSVPPARDLSDLFEEAEREAAALPPVVKPQKRHRRSWLPTGGQAPSPPPQATYPQPRPFPARSPVSLWALFGVPAAAVAVVLALLFWFSGNTKDILRAMDMVFQQSARRVRHGLDARGSCPIG
jgi:hypothetical protein